MSMLQADEQSPMADGQAPYRRGDRVRATSPEGMSYLVRVERVVSTSAGGFHVVGAVTYPRRYRSHLVTLLVDADGCGPAVDRVVAGVA